MSIDMITSQLCDQLKNLSLNDKKDVAIGSHKLAQSALQLFSENKLSEFDALVGDAACQVRAVMVASYAQNKEVVEQSKMDLDKVEKCSKAFIENSKNHTCACSLAKESLHLTEMYILKTTRSIHQVEQLCSHCNAQVPTYREKTEPKQLLPFYKTKNRAKKIVDSSSEAISKAGISFLQEQSKLLSSETTQKMISQENVLVLNDREEIPCFYSIKVLIDIAQKQKIPFLIKVKKSEHTVEKSHNDPFDTAILQANGKEPIALKDPLIVIEGMRISDDTPEEYKKKLASHDIVQLILCNAAQHTQYTGGRSLEKVALLQKEEHAGEKKMIIDLAQKAEALGCSIQNQALFCITHIFCDTMDSQIQSGVKL